MGKTICTVVFWIFVLLYVGALFVFLVGTFGWFGQEQDPLSGIFLLPLGLPWNQFLGFLGDSVRPWATAAAPIVNIAILRLICARLGP